MKVIGHEETLSVNKDWAAVFEDARRRRCLQHLPEQKVNETPFSLLAPKNDQMNIGEWLTLYSETSLHPH